MVREHLESAAGVRSPGNHMRLLGFVPVGATILLAALPVVAKDLPRVAVFRLVDRGNGLDRATLDRLTEHLAGEVLREGVFGRVPAADLDSALAGRSKGFDARNCDSECQNQIGLQAGAELVLATQSLRIGRVCKVKAELRMLMRPDRAFKAEMDGACEEAGLRQSLETIAQKIRSWGSGPEGPGFREGRLGQREEPWEVEDLAKVVVAFEALPVSAEVLVDGKTLCHRTPCSKALAPGEYRVSMRSKRYQERSEIVKLARGTRLAWELRPGFGWLTVNSQPPGLTIILNGQVAGTTPLERKELEPGGYEVLVEGPCLVGAGERVKIEMGKERTVSSAPASREAGLEVTAQDGDGNDLEAQVFVDGRAVGVTPGRFKVSMCAKMVEVMHPQAGRFRDAPVLVDRVVSVVHARLAGAAVAGDMVQVPAGEFAMGCSPGDLLCRADEKPLHKVSLNAYWVDRTEVTVEAYARCVRAGQCTPPAAGGKCNWGLQSKEHHPVNCVDWPQANDYCAWVARRLPTEAEWERAARGGSERPWYGDVDDIAWHAGKAGGATQPVGLKRPNAYGLFDMLGNVLEWTADGYRADFYASSPGRSPTGPEKAERRVLRGGSWYGTTGRVRASSRSGHLPDRRADYIGFRCARSEPSGPQPP